MTRHRDSTCLYASEEQYADIEVLKERVSRLDVKDSVLNYLDEIDDYAARRGIDTNQATLKQILVNSLRTAKDRIVELFTWQQQSVVAAPVVEAENVALVTTKECAKVVASYVDANKNFMSVFAELKVKLAELGFEQVSYKPEDYAIISKLPEYQETVKLFDLRADLAYKVQANLEPSMQAIELNKVNVEDIVKYANGRDIRTRVEGYAEAVKANSPDRYKLAYEIMKAAPIHYIKLNVNGIKIEDVKTDSHQWMFDRIKENQGELKFVTFDSAVRGYLELHIQRLQLEREWRAGTGNDVALNTKLNKLYGEFADYTKQLDQTYGNELTAWGGTDKEISVNKNGGFMETYSRCIENTLTAADMSGIARHVAQHRLEDFTKPRIEYFKAYNEIQPLRDECKRVGAKFELTPEYAAYLKVKISFEAAGAKVHSEIKDYERTLNVMGIKPLEVEQCAEYLPRSQSFQLALDYRSITDDTSREAYELAYKLTGDSRNYYAVQQLELDNKKLQLRSEELLVAHALKKAGVEPLASQSPGVKYIDIVDRSKVSLNEPDGKLQNFLVEYFEADIVGIKAFHAEISSKTQEDTNMYSQACLDAIAKGGKLQNQFKHSELSKLAATKFDASEYTFMKSAVLKGGEVAAYQRALQGRSTSEDFAAISDKLSQKNSLTQSHRLGRSMRH